MTGELSVAPSCNQTNDLNNSHDKATVAATPVVAVIGFSNSGTPRVVAALVESLTARGLKITAIKHYPHGHEPTQTNSDSDRLYGAGAVVAITSSPDQRTAIERVVQDSSLASLATLVQIRVETQPNLIISERFKSSPVPKILVINDRKMDESVTNIVATVGRDRATVGRDGPNLRVTNYSFNDLESLEEWLQKVFIQKPVVAIT
ncbi:MAG TPA: hypothetical protein EYQ67_08075 [Dehalococcoidia bacterium]|nr:hypothetical protein [Dehalococcoidia bacterium]